MWIISNIYIYKIDLDLRTTWRIPYKRKLFYNVNFINVCPTFFALKKCKNPSAWNSQRRNPHSPKANDCEGKSNFLFLHIKFEYVPYFANKSNLFHSFTFLTNYYSVRLNIRSLQTIFSSRVWKLRKGKFLWYIRALTCVFMHHDDAPVR